MIIGIMKWIFIVIVVTEAVYEGFTERGYREGKNWKLLGKAVQGLFIASWFWFAFECKEWHNEFIVYYLLLRLSIFNYINALAAWRKTLLGTTSIVDRLIRFLCLGSIWMYIIFTVICLILYLKL